ncbi:MAG: mercury resistance system transport protein MerF [Deltaproteobacteria bacterium]|nr:mercury resistance system transport protein MerF [Deltaproteobacteria bacterium]
MAMENTPLQKANRCYKGGLWGAVVAAICCFTPVLVIGLGSIGLATVTPYLDWVLFPLLGICLILAGYGWWLGKKRQGQP